MDQTPSDSSLAHSLLSGKKQRKPWTLWIQQETWNKLERNNVLVGSWTHCQTFLGLRNQVLTEVLWYFAKSKALYKHCPQRIAKDAEYKRDELAPSFKVIK